MLCNEQVKTYQSKMWHVIQEADPNVTSTTVYIIFNENIVAKVLKFIAAVSGKALINPCWTCVE